MTGSRRRARAPLAQEHLMGGVTTEDEMFIQAGAYYLELP
jgi:hypothetical protein